MKRLILFVLSAGLGVTAGAFWMNRLWAARHARELENQQAAWKAERASWEAALADAKARGRTRPAPVVVSAPSTEIPARLSPADIILRLQGLLPASGAASPAQMRETLYWLEELVQTGPAALPAIREFLERYEDVELDTAWLQSRAARNGNLPGEFLLPPSLRLGLLDTVRRIGGPEAEAVLAKTLTTTGRGLEVACLTRWLEAMAPGKYRESALSTARALLAATRPLPAAGPLDRYHRDYLFDVLAFYGDATFAQEAQTQLVAADNRIDRSALKYLQQTLGVQAVPLVAQAYQNPVLVTNAAAKEPLARLALNFVGPDARANEFYQQAINDPVLTRGHRKNLIEDLNQDGFADTRNLSATDLPLIESRLSLIEQLAPFAMDDVNAAAFAEAYKDLVNMRAKASGEPPPAR